MKLQFAIGTSVLVIVASIPLIAAFDPPQVAPAKTASAPDRSTEPSLEAPLAAQKQDLPSWAYTPRAPAAKQVPDDGKLIHVPDSSAGYTKTQITLYNPPDWFPNSHPPAPEIVLHGDKAAAATACSYCHLPNGMGRPENASLAGLPAGYMQQQMDDFKAGQRHSAVSGLPGAQMIQVAVRSSPEETKEAIDYFAALKPSKRVEVIEADTVPKTHPALMMLVDEAGGTEPIGNRVIEVPTNSELAELRDQKINFIAYVPTGSLKKGEDLVKNGGNGKTMACTSCHGQDLKGTGNIPSIAGRSPSAMARQLYDFQTGARNGGYSVLMKAPVAKLTDADIVAITGYLASLEPR